MTNYGKVKSSFRPLEVEFTSNSVFLASNIEEYTETIEDKTINGFQYDYTQYTKDEYMMLLIQKTENIDSLREELEATKILLGVE